VRRAGAPDAGARAASRATPGAPGAPRLRGALIL